MRKISSATREQLENEPRMKVCALKGYDHSCSQKIDYHHNLIYGGKQSDIPETIIAICSEAHKIADRKDVKERLEWIMLNQMSAEQIQSVSKAVDYAYKKEQLNRKYKS